MIEMVVQHIYSIEFWASAGAAARAAGRSIYIPIKAAIVKIRSILLDFVSFALLKPYKQYPRGLRSISQCSIPIYLIPRA